MDTAIATLRDLVEAESPGDAVGLYLTGSSCLGGLRPDSDLDLLLLTRRSLEEAERRALVDHLLGCSGRRATRPGRPVELLSLVLGDVVPWRYPATRDFLYGEWLRDEYEAGTLPDRGPDPNLPVVVGSARDHSTPLLGPPLDGLTEPVPAEHVARSLLDALPALLDDLVGDERNVLLTLARMVHTLRTGAIVPKDVAAAEVAPTLPPAAAAALLLAARGYRGEARDDWTSLRGEASATARVLADRIRSLAP